MYSLGFNLSCRFYILRRFVRVQPRVILIRFYCLVVQLNSLLIRSVEICSDNLSAGTLVFSVLSFYSQFTQVCDNVPFVRKVCEIEPFWILVLIFITNVNSCYGSFRVRISVHMRNITIGD